VFFKVIYRSIRDRVRNKNDSLFAIVLQRSHNDSNLDRIVLDPILVCQMLSNAFQPINVFHYDRKLKTLYIQAGINDNHERDRSYIFSVFEKVSDRPR
jgi:hypothetical protein